MGWRHLPLRDLLAEASSLPVVLCHDVRAGGTAEGLVGAAREVPDYLFLPIGTGIAGALFLNGHARVGAHGLGGEIGHMSVDPHGALCRCGRRGCLETVASARAVATRYRERASDSTELDAAEVVRRANCGDPVAQEVWSDAIQALATALIQCTLLVDPQLFVIAGGMAAAGDALIAPLADELAARASFRPHPRVVSTKLGDQAGCLGAAIAAWGAIGVAPSELLWTPA
jgi:glucokinase